MCRDDNVVEGLGKSLFWSAAHEAKIAEELPPVLSKLELTSYACKFICWRH